MIAVLPLAVLVGISLGLVGGGGSILTVPILMYAAHLGAKEAIATSLLVVGSASLVGALHKRADVDWRNALLFGAAGMAGAYGGGRVAELIPGTIIVALFVVMMIVTGVLMLRAGRATEAPPAAPPRRPLVRIVLEGLAVGAVTGLVGAGGGFLVVPALVLLGGLPMKRAVATSLVVIAGKSFAGFAGYLGHVDIDVTLTAVVAGAAIVGTAAGSLIARRVSAARLKKTFAALVLVVAGLMLAEELPGWLSWAGASGIYQAVFVERWPWWAGGAAIALVALAFLYAKNQLLGVSTGCAELTAPRALLRTGPTWRIPFLGGILLGGVTAGVLAGANPTLAMGGLDVLLGGSLTLKALLLFGGGTLIGYGARAAGGCTSGHAIVGVAQGARSSLAATAAFMVGGFVTTHLMVLVARGLSS